MNVYLGFGLQSGGTTLVSYCFLQRGDMRGVLDSFHDRLPDMPTPSDTAYWCKCTIASFRAEEIIAAFEDQGFASRAVLVVRDVRHAFDSLIGKPYGRNSITAEDPPLRTRFRRFLEDWRFFEAEGLPIMRLEAFTQDPEAELRAVCQGMGLPWDPAMMDWPHKPAEIWDGKGGNQGFVDGIGADLTSSLRPDALARPLRKISRADLDWLDETFADYNARLGYPAQLPDTDGLPPGPLHPAFQNASRYRAMQMKRRMHRLLPGVQKLRRHWQASR